MKYLRNKKIVYFFPSDHKEKEWQFYHFVNELQDYNISFDLFNPKKYKQGFEEELLKKIKRERAEISLFITASYDGEISYGTLSEIKKTGIPTLLICYDNLSIPFVHKKTAKYYDLVWLTSKETAYLFRKWGARTIFLPYASNPKIFHPSPLDQKNCVGFIGSCYGNRPLILNNLSHKGIPVEVYTDSSKNLEVNTNPIKKHLKRIQHSLYYFNNLAQFPIGRTCIKGMLYKSLLSSKALVLSENEYLALYPSVPFEKMIALYSQFAITLNVTDLLDTFLLKKPIHKIHLRNFEVPMCGGLQITKRVEEIQSYFEEDREILLYDSEEELLDKSIFYLKNSRKVIEMKKLARRRAENDHTWKKRFSDIYNAIY